MELTDDRFKSILAALRGDSHAGDKRQQPRVGLSGFVSLIPVDNQKPALPRTARVRDIARTGLGLILCQRLKIGRQMLVSLPTLDGPAMLILCRVCHCEVLDTDLCTVGLKFLKQGYAQITGRQAEPTTSVPATDDSESHRIQKAILE